MVLTRRIRRFRLISIVVLVVGFLASLVTIIEFWQRQNNDRREFPSSVWITPTPTPFSPIFAPTPAPDYDNQSEIVYRTPSGERYHRADCQYVRGKAIPLSLAEAKERGLTPCKVCRPPL
jgi:hypothetical protein